MTGCRRGNPIPAASLPTEKIEEGSDCILLSGKMLGLRPALGSNSAPAARQADFTEQVGLDRHGIEAGHVAGFVRAFDIEPIRLKDHGKIIARSPIFVQQEI